MNTLEQFYRDYCEACFPNSLEDRENLLKELSENPKNFNVNKMIEKITDYRKTLTKVFVGEVQYEEEDSGQALIATIYGSEDMFVRIQSWNDLDGSKKVPEHRNAKSLEGKKIKVTVEVIN